jgi:vacuolar-type H+-ATPase catalytic subunit A/Vma1
MSDIPLDNINEFIDYLKQLKEKNIKFSIDNNDKDKIVMLLLKAFEDGLLYHDICNDEIYKVFEDYQKELMDIITEEFKQKQAYHENDYYIEIQKIYQKISLFLENRYMNNKNESNNIEVRNIFDMIRKNK